MRTRNESPRPPLQNRSQQTFRNILDAAARLLETRSFEELTLTEVVSEAGCSVGAFYGRLQNKEALLHALDQRYFDQFAAVIGQAIDSSVLQAGSLDDALRYLADLLLRFHGRQKGLLRALILHARIHRDPAFITRETRLWKLMPRLTERLLRFRGEIAHDDPQKAIVFTILQMLYSIREMLLWPQIARRTPFRRRELARALAHASHAYLVTEPRPTAAVGG